MIKKIIITILIPSLLLCLTGCYSMTDISKESLKTLYPYSKLKVITNNNNSYLFPDNSYFIEQDTLYGKLSFESLPSIQKIIPLKDISAVQIEQINGGNTLLFVIGVSVIIYGFVSLLQGANVEHWH
jgi:hypothetical protein